MTNITASNCMGKDMFGWRTSRGKWSTFALQCMHNVTNIESRFKAMLVLWLGRELYRNMYGNAGEMEPSTPTLATLVKMIANVGGQWGPFPGRVEVDGSLSGNFPYAL
ncbi:hypothetical protein AVEN_253399-1 [Araneus ventricosus]|uniref:Uncharacterized protein n=1 Tax=Araneus ventricosus TaxID=182803 RepID=A0A4Y2L649_ARAVE|nr:hypothetical protein AVEN_253399-1 [Araneus ventricosus]